MVLLIDNYDSFVFNLARYLAELGIESQVVRNDRVTVAEVADRRPDAILLSPGPCTPREAGISIDLIHQVGPSVPILGVCLGHQAIVEAVGGRVVESDRPVHGQTSLVEHDQTGLYEGLSSPMRVARYHSLIAEPQSLPDCLAVTSRTADGVIMGVRHRAWPVHGVQFHPESILTEGGHRLLGNFLRLAGLNSLPPPVGDLPAAIPEPDFFALPIAEDARVIG